MKKRLLIIFSGLLLIFSILFFKEIKSTIKYYYYGGKYKLYKNNGKCPNCEFMFTDGVAEHKKAYQNEGIEAQQTNNDLYGLYKKNKLTKIESNNLFFVRNLTHSKPYILPKASNFIYKICKEYKDDCEKMNLEYIPVLITSVTRTIESVNKLRTTNGNAIKESAHLNGKTFDISYVHFGNNDKQMGILTNILKKYNTEKLCFVKYERNGCLHVTVN